MEQELTITLFSPVYGDTLIAEIWYGEHIWAQVAPTDDGMELTVYPHPKGEAWHLSLEQVQKALSKAAIEAAKTSIFSEYDTDSSVDVDAAN